MRKLLTLQLDSLFDEYIYTDYDEGGNGHSILINYSDKKAFLKDLVDEFKNRAKNLLEVEYQCEGCENTFGEDDKDQIFTCPKCDIEICEHCGTKWYDDEDKVSWTCDHCNF